MIRIFPEPFAQFHKAQESYPPGVNFQQKCHRIANNNWHNDDTIIHYANSDIKLLTDALETTDMAVRFIKLSHVVDDDARYLSNSLQAYQKVTHLELSYSQLGIPGIEALAKAFFDNKSIIYLNLRSALKYENVLENKTKVETCNNTGMKYLANAFATNETLIYVDLSNNQISSEEGELLAAGIKDNKTITYFNLEGNKIGDKGARAWGKSLCDNKSITSLNLRNNEIGSKGLSVLAQALTVNQVLLHLILGQNLIYAGMRKLTEFLMQNKTLVYLNLNNCGIGAIGAKDCASVLKNNKTLIYLGIENNQIGNEGAKDIAEGLIHNTAMTEIDMGNNQIDSAGAKILAESLEKNRTITRIYLGGNPIDTEGWEGFLKTLEANKTLLDVGGHYDINRQEHSAAMSLKIFDCLKRNQQLQDQAFEQVKQGDIQGFKQSLEDGVSINGRNLTQGDKTLVHAALESLPNVLRCLFQHGAVDRLHPSLEQTNLELAGKSHEFINTLLKSESHNNSLNQQ